MPASSIRKVKPSNYHVTLSFLGNVDADEEAKLRKSCQDIWGKSFLLTFDRIVFWRKPKILCLETEPVDAVLDLVRQINEKVEAAEIKTESRPYRPHITLARKASDNIDLAVAKIDWTAQDFCLVESISQQGGVHYQVLQRWPLTTAEKLLET